MLNFESKQSFKKADPDDKRNARLSSKEKRAYRKAHDYICEVSGLKIQSPKRGQNCDADIHHKLPVNVGGRKTLRNLMLVEKEIHKKLHQYANRQVSKKWKGYPGKTRGEKRLNAQAEITKNLSNELQEATRLSRVLDGESPSSVYRDEYKHDPETRDRIDRHLVEGALEQ